MKSLAEHLKTRRSVPFKVMDGPGPDAGTLAAMLEMAARVPDHGKLAPWRFVVISPEAAAALGDKLAALAAAKGDASPERAELERRRFRRAPLVVAVVHKPVEHPKIPEWEQVLSAGAVCLNLLHAAYAFGFGGTWVTEWVAYDADARALLGLTEKERIAGFVHIGTRREPVEDRTRPVMADIVTYL